MVSEKRHPWLKARLNFAVGIVKKVAGGVVVEGLEDIEG